MISYALDSKIWESIQRVEAYMLHNKFVSRIPALRREGIEENPVMSHERDSLMPKLSSLTFFMKPIFFRVPNM